MHVNHVWELKVYISLSCSSFSFLSYLQSTANNSKLNIYPGSGNHRYCTCMSSENKVVKLSLLLLFAVTASQSSTSPEDLSPTGLQKPLGGCKSKLCEFYWTSLIYTRNVTIHHHACLYGNEKQ